MSDNIKDSRRNFNNRGTPNTEKIYMHIYILNLWQLVIFSYVYLLSPQTLHFCLFSFFLAQVIITVHSIVTENTPSICILSSMAQFTLWNKLSFRLYAEKDFWRVLDGISEFQTYFIPSKLKSVQKSLYKSEQVYSLYRIIFI